MIKSNIMRRCSTDLADGVDAEYSGKGVVYGDSARLKYEYQGTTKSGQNDTTSGNTLVNLLITANAMRACGLTGYALAIGDDLIVGINEPDADLEAYCAFEGRCGLIPKWSSPRDLSAATFASGTWLFDGVEYRYVPLLGRLLARLWWTTHPPTAKRHRRYLSGVASGILSTTRGIPGYEELLRHHVMGNSPSEREASRYLKYKYLGNASPITAAQGINALRSRYDLTTAEVDEVRAHILAAGREPTLVASMPPCVEAIINLDAPGCVMGLDAICSLRAHGCIL